MKGQGFALGLIMIAGACGYGIGTPLGSRSSDAASLNQGGPPTQVDESGLKTDDDVAISGLYGWVDLMPGVGFAGGTHTRLQVKFKALSRGCTNVEDFVATLTPVGDQQVLSIKRVKKDACLDVTRPVEFNLNVYGTYKPAAPVVMNGVALPVMERIIY